MTKAFRPILALLTGFFLAGIATADSLKGPINAEVIRVIDGDTIEVNAHIWVGQYIRTKVRLLDIDTPEIRRPKCEAERTVGQEAKAMTERLVGKEVKLYNVKMGSFGGRVLAHLETQTGEDLGAALMAQSLAVAYKADKPWCVDTPQAGLLVKVKAGG